MIYAYFASPLEDNLTISFQGLILVGRLYIAFGVVIFAVMGLVYAAVNDTKKAVVTVRELTLEPNARKNIRLGARVTEDEIFYRTVPDILLRFAVSDISQAGAKIFVSYRGPIPDTLKAGRDVILEGDYSNNEFTAKSLLTQCPSKYEPPIPP